MFSRDSLIDRLGVWCPEAHTSFFTLTHPLKKPWQLFMSGKLHDFNALEYAKTLPEIQRATISTCEEFRTIDDLEQGVIKHVQNTDDRVTWIDLNATRTEEARLFLSDSKKWEQIQLEWLGLVDKSLKKIYDALLPDTTMIVIPQNDVTMLRELRGLRLRSRWADATMEWTNEAAGAFKEAMSGTQDSAMYLCKKT